MSSASMPLRKGPSGPVATIASGILAIGEDIVTGIVNLFTSGAYVESDPGTPLEVAFTEWNAGDVLLIDYSAVIRNQGESGQLEVVMCPAVDVGAGFKFTTGGGSEISLTGAQVAEIGFSVALACAAAPTVRLWAQLLTDAAFIDGTATVDTAPSGGALLRCYRIPASIWIQGPKGAFGAAVP